MKLPRILAIWPMFLVLQKINAQGGINLGSFGLGKSPVGDLLLNFGQGGNLFGLGADRAMNLNIGPGRFGAKSDGGVSVGGQRLGLENLFGIQEGQGLNLGSFLNTGNPVPLGSQNTANAGSDPISKFFAGLMGSGVKPTEVAVVPNNRGGDKFGLAKGNARQPWETDGEETPESSWPTPPTPPDEDLGLEGMEKMSNKKGEVTEAPIFPTLVNMWTEGPEGIDGSSGMIPTGVETNGGFIGLPGEVGPISPGVAPISPEVGTIPQPGVNPTPKRVNTEGWSGQSVIGTARKAGMNSGEASKKSNGKRRGGPPPPAGMIDIDSKEQEELRRVRMRN
ncbi:unnamed protein product [Bursaphelenchus xylophilus]|uniref:(pine wood nematode) hypothetical protein n=1 Tax=Bursaphelenchus xylophilus TaxID=6326 RepID=A0A1I7RW31_BURXY|nr:unnamed protein product [Bursaphelenchus xylophilus]CAG9095061.1 unnamed protein product [Bursaphelenchus xylophilus]